MYCLIIGASYSGSLRSFLILPIYNEPIETLKDVLDSGFSWGYTFTGEEASIINLILKLEKGHADSCT